MKMFYKISYGADVCFEVCYKMN